MHIRVWTGVGLFAVAFVNLCVAAEGPWKVFFILIGSVPIAVLAIGFILPRHRVAKLVIPTPGHAHSWRELPPDRMP